MPATLRLSLYLAALHETTDSLVVVSPSARIAVSDATPGLRAALRLLEGDGADEQALFAQVAGEHFSIGARLRVVLSRLDDAEMLVKTLYDGDERIASAYTTAPREKTPPFDPNAAYTLSRFAYCRRVNGEWSLESPLATARVVLYDTRALARLDNLMGNSETEIAFRRMLLDVGMLTWMRQDGTTDEDVTRTLHAWSFHDALFQMGRREDRVTEEMEPPPVSKPPIGRFIVQLARPDMNALTRSDTPFTRINEQRRSIREQGQSPITAQQLGEFLYRAARVIELIDGDYAASRRPYPSAGALYPLELYPIVVKCEGLSPVLYHYDPLNHVLEILDAPLQSLPPLVESAIRVTDYQVTNPQVLFVITARYARSAWKYGTFALSLIHKDVGVLMAHLYLVATAMQLAPCALGVGHTSHFAAASGIDPMDEFAVAGFWLGSLPD